MSTTPHENEIGHTFTLGKTRDAGKYMEQIATGHATATSFACGGGDVIPIETFWDQLARHDWHSCFSDDTRAYWAGEKDRKRLNEIAELGGEDYKALMAAFSKHYGTGRPWNNKQWDKPPRPVNGVVVIPAPPQEDPKPALEWLPPSAERETFDEVFPQPLAEHSEVTAAEDAALREPVTAPKRKGIMFVNPTPVIVMLALTALACYEAGRALHAYLIH